MSSLSVRHISLVYLYIIILYFYLLPVSYYYLHAQQHRKLLSGPPTYHYNQARFHLGGGGRLLIADDIEEVAKK